MGPRFMLLGLGLVVLLAAGNVDATGIDPLAEHDHEDFPQEVGQGIGRRGKASTIRRGGRGGMYQMFASGNFRITSRFQGNFEEEDAELGQGASANPTDEPGLDVGGTSSGELGATAADSDEEAISSDSGDLYVAKVVAPQSLIKDIPKVLCEGLKGKGHCGTSFMRSNCAGACSSGSNTSSIRTTLRCDKAGQRALKHIKVWREPQDTRNAVVAAKCPIWLLKGQCKSVQAFQHYGINGYSPELKLWSQSRLARGTKGTTSNFHRYNKIWTHNGMAVGMACGKTCGFGADPCVRQCKKLLTGDCLGPSCGCDWFCPLWRHPKAKCTTIGTLAQANTCEQLCFDATKETSFVAVSTMQIDAEMATATRVRSVKHLHFTRVSNATVWRKYKSSPVAKLFPKPQVKYFYSGIKIVSCFKDKQLKSRCMTKKTVSVDMACITDSNMHARTHNLQPGDIDILYNTAGFLYNRKWMAAPKGCQYWYKGREVRDRHPKCPAIVGNKYGSAKFKKACRNPQVGAICKKSCIKRFPCNSPEHATGNHNGEEEEEEHNKEALAEFEEEDEEEIDAAMMMLELEEDGQSEQEKKKRPPQQKQGQKKKLRALKKAKLERGYDRRPSCPKLKSRCNETKIRNICRKTCAPPIVVKVDRHPSCPKLKKRCNEAKIRHVCRKTCAGGRTKPAKGGVDRHPACPKMKERCSEAKVNDVCRKTCAGKKVVPGCRDPAKKVDGSPHCAAWAKRLMPHCNDRHPHCPRFTKKCGNARIASACPKTCGKCQGCANPTVRRVCGKSCNTCFRPFWTSYNPKLKFSTPTGCCVRGDKACSPEWESALKTFGFPDIAAITGLDGLAEQPLAAL